MAPATKTPRPSPVPATREQVLQAFPLEVGNTWVYRATRYDQYQGRDILTVTFRVTTTVTALDEQPPYLVASLISVRRVVSATVAGWREPETVKVLLGIPDGHYWYIVAGGDVYRQELALDLSGVEDSALDYRFPLAGQTGWYQDSQFRNLALTPGFDNSVDGRWVKPEPSVQVPAGTFSNCYHLNTMFNMGGIGDWICPGVGLVRAKFDHVGTPFGYDAVLISFTARR